MSLVNITSNAENKSWPVAARGLCHHCAHKFDGIPVLVPIWDGTTYHLIGNYCSWNCAKSRVIETRPKRTSLTTLALFAYQISFRGRWCPERQQRKHPSTCPCHARFAGITPAGPKEDLQAFGGTRSIQAYRRGFLTIDSYDWISRFYNPRELADDNVPRHWLYTLDPIETRGMKVIPTEEDEDPIVLIKRRNV